MDGRTFLSFYQIHEASLAYVTPCLVSFFLISLVLKEVAAPQAAQEVLRDRRSVLLCIRLFMMQNIGTECTSKMPWRFGMVVGMEDWLCHGGCRLNLIGGSFHFCHGIGEGGLKRNFDCFKPC
jgi:hypothetical protein